MYRFRDEFNTYSPNLEILAQAESVAIPSATRTRYQATCNNGGVIRRILTTSSLQHNPLETTAKLIRHPCVMCAGTPKIKGPNVSITLIPGPRLTISVD